MSEKKWSCEYCTYENWPASRKCALCNGLKPNNLVNEEATIDEHDIYKVASKLSIQPTPPPSVCVSTPGATAACEQGSDLSPLCVSVSAQSSGQSSPQLPSDEPRRSVPRSATVKWTCRACTYTNWPRAKCCVMCSTTRGRTYAECHGAMGGSNSPPRQEDNASPRASDIAPTSQSLNESRSSVNSPTNARDCDKSNEASRLSPEILDNRRSPPNSPVSNMSPKNTRVSPTGSGRTSDAESGAAAASPSEDTRRRRNRHTTRRGTRATETLWLSAVHAVAAGDVKPVEAYLQAGGSVTRQITGDEALALNKPTLYQQGTTLIHIALSCHRQDMLQLLLTASELDVRAFKRLPHHAAPDAAAAIQKHLGTSLRMLKGDFPCLFVTDCPTFTLPSGILDLPARFRKQLLEEILDRGVQAELEDTEQVINWSSPLVRRLGSRLYPVWNRTAGDCLLDSVLQAAWAVFDQDNILRRALAQSLDSADYAFYERWRGNEQRVQQQSEAATFSLDELQWQRDWQLVLRRARQQGASLEQIHIFCLAHIMRRPIIVYSVKFIKNFKGEPLGESPFQGVYLPLLWERSFCWSTPLVLGYTRGHFSALVTMATDNEQLTTQTEESSNREQQQEGCSCADDALNSLVCYLPLVDCRSQLLPLHFLSDSERRQPPEKLLRVWLDCCVTDANLLVAKQLISRPATLVRQMTTQWLDRHRPRPPSPTNTVEQNAQ